jgi:serine/threonine protein kinase
LFLVCAVAYFLLVGEPVFTGETIVEVFARHLHAAPVPPSERSQHAIPASLERVVLRCLEKDPERRFPTALAMLADLKAMADVAIWSDEDARAWWRERGDALVRALRTEQAARAGAAGTTDRPDTA